MHILSFSALFLFLIGNSCCSSENSVHERVEGNPSPYDEWCRVNCDSSVSCYEKFGDNFIDLRVRNDFSISEDTLLNGLFLGDTISKQSFETQFIFDISRALLISPCRLYVIDATLEGDGLSLNQDCIFVTFRLFPVDHDLILDLTKQVQDHTSKIYDGHITHTIDDSFGVFALKWDFSIKLFYSIDIVGGDHIEYEHTKDGDKILNQGSERWCENKLNHDTEYCEFEKYFRQDLSNSLDVSFEQVHVIFIKTSGHDSVLVTFRFIPPKPFMGSSSWVQSRFLALIEQIHDYQSHLYSGNVTFRIDSAWGISGSSRKSRSTSKRLNRSVRPSSIDAYDRCKATQRCNRGWDKYNQLNASSESTMQIFAGGLHRKIPLFVDFEDWRQGPFTWERSSSGDGFRDGTPQDEVSFIPKGSYWSPFMFKSLGPLIPSFNTSSNSGLVLNKKILEYELERQENWIQSIQDYLVWLRNEAHITSLDARTRTRIDIREQLHRTELQYEKRLRVENEKKIVMRNSQCVGLCELVFNTSSLELWGIINATGDIAVTPDGTEVGVWAFDSIDLGSEVNIHVTGQRAMALLSKSSVYINTKIIINPGTLGGFPGGYSLFRSKDRLVSVCSEELLDEDKTKCLANTLCCPGDRFISKMEETSISSNINGPGSSSLRYYLFTIQIIAPINNEVQAVYIDADKGQLIGGGFLMKFNGYTTPFIPHDVSAKNLKHIMEDSLNAARVDILGIIERTKVVSGIGVVDVSRFSFGTSGGFKWKITFRTAVGNIGIDSSPLEVTNLLSGMGANISISTLEDGNTIGGTFSLKFLNSETRRLYHNISGKDFQECVLQDIPSIDSADVYRTDPLGDCNDGFCDSAKNQAGGHSWTITLSTTTGNISPRSPTSKGFDTEGERAVLSVKNFLTGCVEGDCPEIKVTRFHNQEVFRASKSIKFEKPFSLAFGGGGGGYGGQGGEGYGSSRRSKPYGDNGITNLYGGSGGALGIADLFEIDSISDPSRFRGGSGGGAIKIVAVNDLVFGPNAIVSCDGENGWGGYMTSGGGGSAGSILLSAGGALFLNGTLTARGGNGGFVSNPDQLLSRSGGGGGGGRIALYGNSIGNGKSSFVDVSGGINSSIARSFKDQGEDGTIFEESNISRNIYVDNTEGAFGTNKSLHISAPLSVIKRKRGRRTNIHGPTFTFSKSERPERFSLFVKFSNLKDDESPLRGWGVSIYLKEAKADQSSGIVISIGQTMLHGIVSQGGNYKVDHKQGMKSFYRGTMMDVWYKLDVRLDWKIKKYNVLLDDVLVSQGVPFHIDKVDFVSISHHLSNVGVWLDELYAGYDTSIGFQCPTPRPDGSVHAHVPAQKGWKGDEIGGSSTQYGMNHHESHLSRREIYSHPEKSGVLEFDGLGHRDFFLDIKFRPGEGEQEKRPGAIMAGSFLKVTPEMNSTDSTLKKHSNTDIYMWYSEYETKDQTTGDDLNKSLFGGVVACATTDFKTWTNKGIMLNYVNLTDMALGTEGPLHVERPKVLYNNYTRKFVMWMAIDNEDRNLALAGVATSDYADGPFTFVRSFYPDGNKTRDQTIFHDSDGKAYLVRTFFATTNYVLPSRVMQPIWESVKKEDGSTNFPLTYHRAHFESEYDNFHDIYLQRWRNEDRPWKVVCVDETTEQEREVPFGERYEKDELCKYPFEYKKVIGQSSPLQENSLNGIQSRFLDPLDPINNYWKASSVPGVKSQPWGANYQDGSCGMRKLNEDLQIYDPNLPEFQVENRQECSNIADNPIHPTSPDQRVGLDDIVERRRAQYVAVSQLTDDFLDTSGILHMYEGELEDGMDLISIVNQAKTFGTQSPGSEEVIQSASKPDVNGGDNFKQSLSWDTKFHQFEEKYNDRSFYSTACVFDGQCQGTVHQKDSV